MMFQIHPISQETVNELGFIPYHERYLQDPTDNAINQERRIHEKRAEKRMHIFQNILNNTQPACGIIRPLATSLASVVIAIILIGSYTMVPVHNVFEYPEKWFEYPLQCLFSFWPIYAAHILFDSIYFLNTDYIRTLKTFAALFSAVVVVSGIEFALSYYIWAFVFGLRYPVPLIGYINFFTMTVTNLSMIWFQFPSTWRNNQAFRRRLKWNMLTILALNLCVAEYIGFTAALVLTPEGFQWVIAIILPFFREINVWITTSLLKNCHDGDPLGGKIYIIQCLSNIHSAFLAYSVGTLATLTTSIVIIAGDFIINILNSLRLIRLKHKEDNFENNMERIDIILDLVISELTEALTPLTYLGCVIMAYYGPNAETIGNIRNSWFHFSEIEDFDYSLEIVAALFFFDLGSVAMTAGLLWKFCHINLFQAFAALQNEFWLAFGNNLVTSFLGVRIKFNWFKNREKLSYLMSKINSY